MYKYLLIFLFLGSEAPSPADSKTIQDPPPQDVLEPWGPPASTTFTTEEIREIVLKSAKLVKDKDPLKLEDIINRFIKYKPMMYFTFNGIISLTNGKIFNLSDYNVDDDDDIVHREDNNYTIYVHFPNLKVEYEYDSAIGVLSNYGTLESLLDIRVAIPVTVKNRQFELSYEPYISSGDINAVFQGSNTFMNFIFNALSSTFKSIFNDLLRDKYVDRIAHMVINGMNKVALSDV